MTPEPCMLCNRDRTPLRIGALCYDCQAALQRDAKQIRDMTKGERAVLWAVFHVAGLPTLARLCEGE